ncbi:hypothetical protein SCHPADRAFT_615476 [Schizopora paradoxa]|uniref:Uncharacterized protein n=1 Tax=Schizopora paradoxa TaxID=27342 RepID=A0A0H2RA51_9AGAM|nr:hypothetical protein SCHPADRAFT_615476 [Schizopora paradoxa]
MPVVLPNSSHGRRSPFDSLPYDRLLSTVLILKIQRRVCFSVLIPCSGMTDLLRVLMLQIINDYMYWNYYHATIENYATRKEKKSSTTPALANFAARRLVTLWELRFFLPKSASVRQLSLKPPTFVIEDMRRRTILSNFWTTTALSPRDLG